jgi:hypothetical protein
MGRGGLTGCRWRCVSRIYSGDFCPYAYWSAGLDISLLNPFVLIIGLVLHASGFRLDLQSSGST